MHLTNIIRRDYTVHDESSRSRSKDKILSYLLYKLLYLVWKIIISVNIFARRRIKSKLYLLSKKEKKVLKYELVKVR